MLHPLPLVRTSMVSRVRCFLFPPARANLVTTPPLSSVSEGDHFLPCPVVTLQGAWDAPFQYVLGDPGTAWLPACLQVSSGWPTASASLQPSGAAVPDSAPNCCTRCALMVLVPLAHPRAAQPLSGFRAPLLARPHRQGEGLPNQGVIRLSSLCH